MSVAPHYSPAVRTGDLVFTSGQLPLLDRDAKTTPATIEEQTRLVLERAEAAIGEFGLSRKNIVKTTAFISNMDDWGKVNAIYAEFFGDHKPARSIIPTPPLHFGCLIELEAIAAMNAEA